MAVGQQLKKSRHFRLKKSSQAFSHQTAPSEGFNKEETFQNHTKRSPLNSSRCVLFFFPAQVQDIFWSSSKPRLNVVPSKAVFSGFLFFFKTAVVKGKTSFKDTFSGVGEFFFSNFWKTIKISVRYKGSLSGQSSINIYSQTFPQRNLLHNQIKFPCVFFLQSQNISLYSCFFLLQHGYGTVASGSQQCHELQARIGCCSEFFFFFSQTVFFVIFCFLVFWGFVFFGRGILFRYFFLVFHPKEWSSRSCCLQKCI